MNPKPQITDPTLLEKNDAKPHPSSGPLKKEPTPERAAREKKRQEDDAAKKR